MAHARAMPSWFGAVPTPVWVGVCLAIALVYVRAWPRKKAAGLTRGPRYFVLRWFHALVWVLLALAVAVRARAGQTAYVAASAIALAALVVYVVFVIVSFAAPVPAAPDEQSSR